jgi:hypothetical protein
MSLQTDRFPIPLIRVLLAPSDQAERFGTCERFRLSKSIRRPVMVQTETGTF